MAREPPQIQEQFDGGEISPRMRGRVHSDVYKKALLECLNFEPLPQGSLRMRAGSGLQFPLSGDTRTKMVSVRMSTGEDFLLELLEKKMNIYAIAQDATQAEVDVTATPSTIGQTDLILNGSFSTPEGDKWLGVPMTQANGVTTSPAVDDFGSDTNSGLFLGLHGTPWSSFRGLNPPDENTQRTQIIPAVPLGYAAIATGAEGGGARRHFTCVLYQKIQTPFDNTTIAFSFKAAISANATLTIKISSTDPTTWAGWDSGGEIFSYNWGSHGGEALRPLQAGDAVSATLPAPLTPGAIGPQNVPVAGFYWISYQIEDVPQGTTNFCLLDDLKAIAVYTVPGTSGGAVTSIPTPWTANEVAALQWETETGRDRTVFVHGDHEPWFLLYGGVPGNWQFGTVAFVSLPLGWGDQGSTNVPVSWNWLGLTSKLAKANWPSAIAFHDGRLYYGGEKAQANRILASKSGSSDDFTLGTNPGDALDFKLSTKGQIHWITPGSHTVLIGTDIGVHSLTGSTGTPLVGDLQAREEFEGPNSSIRAISLGIYVVYVSSDFRQVYATTFDFRTGGLEPEELSFNSEHITAPLIKELLHARAPVNMIPCIMQDGTLVIYSFEPKKGILAAWRVNVGGVVCSAAVTQGPLGAYLWMAVARTKIGPIQQNLVPIVPTGPITTIYLEKFQLSETTEFIRYLDTSKFSPSDANGQISGFDHLEGQTVRVCGTGGSMIGDFPVVGGNVQLGPDFINGGFYAGLPYLARAQTMPRDLRHGKGQQPKAGVTLNDSAFPKVNGKRPKDRTPSSPTGHAEPKFTGKKTVSNIGWTDDEIVTLEQDLPLRTEICSLFTILESGEM